MKLSKPGKVLSKVLFDISLKDQSQEKMLMDLANISKIINVESQVRSFIQSKRIPSNKKFEILNQVFRDSINSILLEVISLLSGPDSVNVINSINKSFIDRYKEQNNIVDVKVVLAKKLNLSQMKNLESSISKSLDKNIDLSVEVDEKILGGVKLRVEDTFLDGSIINQLQSLQSELLQI